jgi:nucleoside-triphosphatase
VTEELRESGQRIGFVVETFAGERATLAHIRFAGPPRVGRYGVDLDAFERLALPALRGAKDAAVLVIDELGKMELASESFRDAVSTVFDGALPTVATVQAARHPFTDALKADSAVDTLGVTRANRDALPQQLAARLTGAERA